jgi:hypothetical protein
MKCAMNNERGFAMVFGLIVLLLATVGGTAILFMAQKDHTGASDYIQMRSASQAAVAGLKACEGQFLDDPNTALAILTQYTTNNAFKWMFGTAANANNEHKITLGTGTNPPQYSARIVNYDIVSQFVIIEAIGYISSGGKKKALASYHLSGLGLSDQSIGMSYALFLGGQLENCNEPISIQGDVYLSAQGSNGPDNQHFNSGGTINGNFKTASSTNCLDFSQKLVISGNAFFQCNMQPQALIHISKNAGLTKGFSNWSNPSPNVIEIDGNGYFTQTTNFGFINCICGDNGGNKTVYYNKASISSNRFKDFTNDAQIPTSTAEYVATQLGMTTSNETPFGLNIPTWGAGVVENLSGIISAATVENYWTTHQAAGTLYKNEWLVIQLTNNLKTNGGTFTKKAIWITGSYTLDGNSKFYNCSDESNTLIIVNSSGHLESFGPGDNYNFRGLVYVNSTYTNNMSYLFGSNSKFYGAIHIASNSKFNLNSGSADSARIWFSHPLGQSAVQEIVNTGIILAPGQATPAARTPMIVDIKIRPSLVSMQL